MTEDDLKTPSFCSVHFVAAEQATPLRTAAPGRVLASLDGGQVEGDRQLFAFLAEAFGFPDYFGHNWDAVDECLRDLSWLPGTGYVLFVDHALRFWERSPRTAGTLVETWLAAAAEWSRDGIPFHLIFVW